MLPKPELHVLIPVEENNMPKTKKEELIKIIKQSVTDKISPGFAGMWFLSQTSKRLKKRLVDKQQLRSLVTYISDKQYVTLLLDGLNDSYIWAVWKINEIKTPVLVHGKKLNNIDYKPEWMGFYEHSVKGGCEILGHHPMPKLGFNGRASFSVCKHCNKSIENSGEGWVESL